MTAAVEIRAPAAAFRQGVRESLGMPGLMLGASYLGFGSLVHGSGWSVWLGLASTASGWALPGQIAMVELYGVGASLAAITAAVLLTNTRLLPMTITLMPLIRDRSVPGWRHYLHANMVAVTGWVVAMRRCPELPVPERMPYFLGFTLSLWLISLVATAAGFGLAGAVPRPVTVGLVFLNPIYFMLMFADVRHRAWLLALGLGCLLGPLLHRIDADWGLMLTGLLGGSGAFFLDRWLKRPATRSARHV